MGQLAPLDGASAQVPHLGAVDHVVPEAVGPAEDPLGAGTRRPGRGVAAVGGGGGGQGGGGGGQDEGRDGEAHGGDGRARAREGRRGCTAAGRGGGRLPERGGQSRRVKGLQTRREERRRHGERGQAGQQRRRHPHIYAATSSRTLEDASSALLGQTRKVGRCAMSPAAVSGLGRGRIEQVARHPWSSLHGLAQAALGACRCTWPLLAVWEEGGRAGGGGGRGDSSSGSAESTSASRQSRGGEEGKPLHGDVCEGNL